MDKNDDKWIEIIKENLSTRDHILETTLNKIQFLGHERAVEGVAWSSWTEIVEKPYASFIKLTRPIKCTHPACLVWIYFVFLLALASIFLSPYRISFQYEKTNSWIAIIEDIFDAFFLLNTVLYCTHIVPTRLFHRFNGDIESTTSRWEIFVYRLQRRSVYIYSIGSIPWDSILRLAFPVEENGVFLCVIGSLRLLRTSFIIDEFRRLENDVRRPYMLVQIAKFLLFFVLFIHLFGCLLYHVANFETDFESSWLYIAFQNKHNSEVPTGHFDLYIFCIYFAVVCVTTVGFGDISPQNTTEYCLFNCMLLVNFFFSAWLIGNMTWLVSESSQQIRQFRQKFRILNTFLTQTNNLPDELSESVKSHFMLQFNVAKEHMEILNDLPVVLKGKIQRLLFRRFVEKSIFAKGTSDAFIDAITCVLTMEVLMTNTDCVAQFDTAFEMYLLISGTADVFIDNPEFYHDDLGDALAENDSVESYHGSDGGWIDDDNNAVKAAYRRQSSNRIYEEVLKHRDDAGDPGASKPRRLYINTLGEGDCFGDLSFLFFLQQPFTITTNSICRVLVLSRASWEMLTTIYPDDVKEVYNDAQSNLNLLANEYLMQFDDKDFENTMQRSRTDTLRRIESTGEDLNRLRSDTIRRHDSDHLGRQRVGTLKRDDSTSESLYRLRSDTYRRHDSERTLRVNTVNDGTHKGDVDSEDYALGPPDLTKKSESTRRLQDEGKGDVSKKETDTYGSPADLTDARLRQRDSEMGGRDRNATVFSYFDSPPHEEAARREGSSGKSLRRAVTELASRALTDTFVDLTALVNKIQSGYENDKILELLVASSSGDMQALIRLCANRKLNVNAVDFESRTALHAAAGRGHTECIKYLLSKGAKVQCFDNSGNTPLFEAVRHGHESAANALKSVGGSLGLWTEKDAESTTPTHFRNAKDAGVLICQVAASGDSIYLDRLLRYGLKVNSTDYDGRTALHVAAARGKTGIIEVLLSHKADPSILDNFGRTPLLEAVKASHVACAQRIYEVGGSLKFINIVNSKRHTDKAFDDILVDVEVTGQVDESTDVAPSEALSLMQCLPLYQAPTSVFDPSAVGTDGSFSGLQKIDSTSSKNHSKKRFVAGIELCLAAFEDDSQYIQLLLGFGCQINAADYEGRTAAHVACTEGNVRLAIALLQQGADFVSDAVRNRSGKTPLEEAQAARQFKLVQIVKSILSSGAC